MMKLVLASLLLLVCNSTSSSVNPGIIKLESTESYEFVDPGGTVYKPLCSGRGFLHKEIAEAIKCAEVVHLGKVRIKDGTEPQRVAQNLASRVLDSLGNDQRFVCVMNTADNLKIAPNHIVLLCSVKTALTLIMTPLDNKDEYNVALSYFEHKE